MKNTKNSSKKKKKMLHVRMRTHLLGHPHKFRGEKKNENKYKNNSNKKK